MNITDKTINDIEALAKLSIGMDERKQIKADMNKLTDYIHIISEMPLDEEINTMNNTSNIFREDRVAEFEDKEKLLDEMISKKNNCIQVPNTF